MTGVVEDYPKYIADIRATGGGVAEKFWELARKPRAAAKATLAAFEEFRRRVMPHRAQVSTPQEPPRFLASYAHNALARATEAELSAPGANHHAVKSKAHAWPNGG
jgi:hypothetical protein